MRIAAVFVLLGCGGSGQGSGTDADADTDTTSASDTETETATPSDDERCDGEIEPAVGDVRLNQLSFAFDGQDFVELENPGGADQSLTGWVLATSPTRVYQFAAGLVVPAGGCITLYWGPNDPCDFAHEACGVGGFVNDLTASTGDVAILVANDVDCPGALVDYVRWGNAEPEVDSMEGLALEAGEWPESERVDTTGWIDGQALQYDDSGEGGAAHWRVEDAPRRCE